MIWLGRDENGLPVGVDDDRHLGTTAQNRSGKGTGLIIPNLIKWPGSTVIIDPKGENAAITARHRAKMLGHKVVVFDPFHESKLPDEFLGNFNPLDMIDIESDDAIDIAGLIADSLIVKANDKDMHWDESASQLIAGLILHVCNTEEGEHRNLGRVRQLLTIGDPMFRDAMMMEDEDEEREAGA